MKITVLLGVTDGGIEEMTEDLSGGKILYAYLKVIDPNTNLPKFVFINWVIWNYCCFKTFIKWLLYLVYCLDAVDWVSAKVFLETGRPDDEEMFNTFTDSWVKEYCCLLCRHFITHNGNFLYKNDMFITTLIISHWTKSQSQSRFICIAPLSKWTVALNNVNMAVK